MPKKRKRNHQQKMICPYCGALMEIRPSAEIYHDPQNHERLLVCRNYPRCNTYARLEQGTDRPLGIPANGDLRNLRQRAHRSFDELWKDGYMTRDTAYRWMADFLGIPLGNTHIAMFGTYQCKSIIEKCEELKTQRRTLQK